MTYVDTLVRHVAQSLQARRVGAKHGHRWCHLWADTEAELHEFAAKIGMKRAWARTSRVGLVHYDLVPPRRAAAVAAGATAVDRKTASLIRARAAAGACP